MGLLGFGPERSKVRYWYLADMLFTLANVCFWVESGHDANGPLCRLMTQSGHVAYYCLASRLA
jgi:hypothetical protein